MAELQIVECVPNFSEGAEREKVEAIVRAMQVDGVHLLDWSLDADHNRSVVTIAGAPEAVVEAAIRGAGKAAELIDLVEYLKNLSSNDRVQQTLTTSQSDQAAPSASGTSSRTPRRKRRTPTSHSPLPCDL